MEERKFIKLKKEEFGIKEAIRRNLGMGKISRLDIEYTPVGEKIIISTSRPGLVIGRRGEKIEELTQLLKRRFKLENPHIEIKEIDNPLFDSQLVADEIAMALERMGNLKFKVIAYRKLQDIMKEGALGCELRITGKLPSERARSWRFAQGYLKKAGESRKEIDRAEATALTKTGIIGVKVAIMNPQARIYDKIDIDDKMKAMIKGELNLDKPEEEADKPKKKKKAGSESKASEKLKKKATKAVKKVIEAKEKADKNKKPKEKASLLEKGEAKVIEASSNLKIKPEEDGTAMLVAEELEEGVPGKQIDEDIKESIENKKEEKEKLDKAKKPEEVKK
jgi:small subunit ribosomal protein S3